MVEVARRTSTTIPTGAGVCSPGVNATWTTTVRARLVRMSTTQTGTTPTCYRHPDRETRLACSECGRPICTECMTPAPVGLRCPDHAGSRRPAVKAPRLVRRTSGGATEALVTKTLIAANLFIYVITWEQGSGINAPGGSLFVKWALYGPAVAQGDWWRLI